MSKKTRQNKSKKEFRKLNSKEGSGHPTYIYAKVGKDYKFLGITHSDITRGVRNIALDRNPNPKDESRAYIRTKASKAERSSFGKRLDGWKFSESDKPKVRQIIEKNEKPRK